MDKKNKKKRKKKITIVVVVIVLILIIFNIFKPKKVEENKIETENIEKRDIATSISATGTIETDSTKNITSKLTGFEIKSVNVKEGDKISVGDVICSFDTTDVQQNLVTMQNSVNITKAQSNIGIQSARRSLNDAIENKNTQVNSSQKDVDSALTAYNDAQNQLNSVNALVSQKQDELKNFASQNDTILKSTLKSDYDVKGVELKQIQSNLEAKKAEKQYLENNKNEDGTIDETKLQTVIGEIAQLESDLLKVNSEYLSIKNKYESIEPIQVRYQALNTELENLIASKSTLEATVNQLKTAYDKTVQAHNGAVKTADSTIASLRDSLTNSELSSSISTQSQETQIRAYKDQIQDGVLKSTVNGTVTSVSVKKGDIYTGTTIAVIEDCEEFIIESEIDEYDIADVKVGMKVLVKTDATRNEELEGRVIYAASSATENAAMGMTTASTGIGAATYKVKIALEEQNDRLRLGMNARLSIITDSREKVLSVPCDAVYEREDGTKYIEILKNEETEEKQEITVKTGLEGTYYIEVISNEIKEGMKVILPEVDTGNSIEALIEMMGADAGL